MKAMMEEKLNKVIFILKNCELYNTLNSNYFYIKNIIGKYIKLLKVKKKNY